jgi:hypothetical protein
MASSRHHSRAIIILAVLAASGVCTPAQALDFAGGTGTPDDPYQIATAEQLVGMGRDPNLFWSHFILVNDIDLDRDLPGGQVFQQAVIGPADANFYGSFDGQGFKVLNLTIDARGRWAESLALFSQIGETGRVCNLGLENVVIRGGSDSRNVAALVGVNWGCVMGCRVSGSVSAGVGGLCGENRYFLQSSYSTASVSGDSQVGGLVGRTIPSMSFRSRTGGTVGGIRNCYSAGVVSGHDSVGGLIGEWGEPGGYSAASASFWDIEVSGLKTSAGGIGLATSQMTTAAIFAAYLWDRDPNWVMADGKDYPRLAWEETGGRPIEGDISGCFEGAGTPQNPYRIGTPEQFALIGLGLVPDLLNKHFVLEADLDLGQSFLLPIGQGTGGSSSFSGFFHGNGHVLRNASVGALGQSGVGLFGGISPQGRVSNLGLEGILITAGPRSVAAGTLAAANAGGITGCYAIGALQAQQCRTAGGLVGYNVGRIAYCHADVPVIGSPLFGDLVGNQDSSGLILECYVAGNGGSGTLVGNNQGVVANSYSTEGPPGSFASADGFPLSFSDIGRRESFVGWDFAGSSADGPVDRWVMRGRPILSWQADLQGLRPIPDVGNLPLEWARAEIELAGFVVGEITYDCHSTIPREDAIVTSPLGLAAPGSIINVVLSRGRYSYFNNYAESGYSPYLIQIATPGQLEYFAGGFSKSTNFILIRNIDMAGWEVLPTRTTSPSYSSPAFAGTFLGNGHKVSNLRLFRGSGLFDQIASEGMVHGLMLENVVVTGSTSESLGALAAINQGAVLDCSVQGTIVGGDSVAHLGGLIGKNEGVVSECSAATTIRGQYVASSARETMTDLPGTGGLVGLNSSGTIVDSYATGDVSGGGWTGGLVGGNYAPISRCYAITRVTAQAVENAGGLVEHNPIIPAPPYRGRAYTAPLSAAEPAPVTECYFLGATSGGGPDNGVGTALTTEQMGQQASFVGWDFGGVWTICEGRDYPRLRWEGAECESQ